MSHAERAFERVSGETVYDGSFISLEVARYRYPDGPYTSAPVTIEISSSVPTRRVELAVDPCSTVEIDEQGRRKRGHEVWLFEVEVFAKISNLEAWYRRFTS